MKQRSSTNADLELGRKIRLRRTELRISQTDLGEKLGVSFQQVQKYEKGVNRVGASRLEDIAKALSVPMTFFFTESNTKPQQEVESLLFLDSKFSLRLLKAYAAIKDKATQHNIVTLMESLGKGK